MVAIGATSSAGRPNSSAMATGSVVPASAIRLRATSEAFAGVGMGSTVARFFPNDNPASTPAGGAVYVYAVE